MHLDMVLFYSAFLIICIVSELDSANETAVAWGWGLFSCGRGNGAGCFQNSDCNSGWCESVYSKNTCHWQCASDWCQCKAKRSNMQSAYMTKKEPWKWWDYTSCQSNHGNCGTCLGWNQKLDNGKRCMKNDECSSDWCRNSGPNCIGKCEARKAPGVAINSRDYNQCESRRGVCGTCGDYDGKVENGKTCTENKDCKSGWCHGCAGSTLLCNGKCAAKAGVGEDFKNSDCGVFRGMDGNSCASGHHNRCTCTDESKTVGQGMKCDVDADCRAPLFCRWPKEEQKNLAFYKCVGVCEGCPATCGALSCHTRYQDGVIKCGKQTGWDQFKDIGAGIADSLSDLMECFVPNYKAKVAALKCIVEAAESAASCWPKSGAKECKIQIGKPIPEQKGEKGGCLHFDERIPIELSYEKEMSKKTTAKGTAINAAGLFVVKASCETHFEANAIVALVLGGNNPRLTFSIVPPKVTIKPSLTMKVEGLFEFDSEPATWQNMRYPLTPPKVVFNKAFMAGPVPIVVVIEVQPVVYISWEGRAEFQAQIKYEGNGELGLSDKKDPDKTIDLEFLFGGDGDIFKMNDFKPAFNGKYKGDWSYSISGQVDATLTASIGVDISIIVQGVTIRISPLASANLRVHGELFAASDEPLSGDLDIQMDASIDLKTRLSLLPLQTSKSQLESAIGGFGSLRRHLSQEEEELLRFSIEYERCPECYLEKVRKAKESAVGDDGLPSILVKETYDFWDIMRQVCTTVAAAANCPAAGTICEKFIELIRSFVKWDGKISLPALPIFTLKGKVLETNYVDGMLPTIGLGEGGLNPLKVIFGEESALGDDYDDLESTSFNGLTGRISYVIGEDKWGNALEGASESDSSDAEDTVNATPNDSSDAEIAPEDASDGSSKSGMIQSVERVSSQRNQAKTGVKSKLIVLVGFIFLLFLCFMPQSKNNVVSEKLEASILE